jgi:hypothetical protein
MGINLQRLKRLKKLFQPLNNFNYQNGPAENSENDIARLSTIQMSLNDNLIIPGSKSILIETFPAIINAPHLCQNFLTCLFKSHERGEKSKFEKANPGSDQLPAAFEVMRKGYVKTATLSLSLVKLFFPHTCKNIFVHTIEKTNLLFRMDNNTGFFTRKILQTTTI